MPLVKGGRIVDDEFVRVADDAPLPDGGRCWCRRRAFSRMRSEFAQREAPTGVIWPNNRGVAELVPYLDRLALIALVFPTFRDGRAYSQARLLRERYGFRGELRATGQVLRDQFLFLLRAGFDAFEVKKESRRRRRSPRPPRAIRVFYQPTGDGRLTALHRRMQLRPSQSASQ